MFFLIVHQVHSENETVSLLVLQTLTCSPNTDKPLFMLLFILS